MLDAILIVFVQYDEIYYRIDQNLIACSMHTSCISNSVNLRYDCTTLLSGLCTCTKGKKMVSQMKP